MSEKIKVWIPSILLGMTIVIEIALDIFETNIQVALGLIVLLLVPDVTR